MAAQLRYMMSHYFGTPPSKEVIQDLYYALRTKGGLTPKEEETLLACNLLPGVYFIVGSVLGTFAMLLGSHKGLKLLGRPPNSPLRSLTVYGYGFIVGKACANETWHQLPELLLDREEGRMKTELAKIILNKHSDDIYLVEVVRRHFFVEHLFDDLHQGQPLFRWRLRHTYVDSTFVERTKEVEASNSDDVARSISRETITNTTPFGEMMEDSLACILGSPGCNMESNNPPEKTANVLTRSDLRARRRGRRHHRHADD
ncbi:hypothetical protein ZEAMMB73_Zm00001d014158 [Zea mays]|uniref:Uncharacterized protein n=2 Tax=Zea mays TaxID=4577 RepID=A0A1D6GQC3_MAIZE|nr:hypothetical protein ZEAMMB73_Zm00001d014158 [Zea mays]